MTPPLTAAIRPPVPRARPNCADLAIRLAALADKVDAGAKIHTVLSTAEVRLIVERLVAPGFVFKAPQHAVEANERAPKPKPRVRVKARTSPTQR